MVIPTLICQQSYAHRQPSNNNNDIPIVILQPQVGFEEGGVSPTLWR